MNEFLAEAIVFLQISQFVIRINFFTIFPYSQNLPTQQYQATPPEQKRKFYITLHLQSFRIQRNMKNYFFLNAVRMKIHLAKRDCWSFNIEIERVNMSNI